MNDENMQEDVNEIEAVRAALLNAYADCIPELVRGETVGELLASVEPARAVFARVAETVSVRIAESVPAAPTVPAGGGSAIIDPSYLPAAEKVRRGIAVRNR